MSERRVWEEKLFTSNSPFPTRPGPQPTRRQWVEDGLPLLVWGGNRLAPVERSWEPLGPGREVLYVSRNQTVRVALVDVEAGLILDWRREAGSSAYAPRAPRAAPDLHPMERLHHRRGR